MKNNNELYTLSQYSSNDQSQKNKREICTFSFGDLGLNHQKYRTDSACLVMATGST